MPRLSIGSVEVSDDTAQWLNVILNLAHESRRGIIKALIIGHVSRWRGKYIIRVEKFARANNLAWEQAYTLLADTARKPPYTDKDFLWASRLSPAECLTTRSDEELAIRPKNGSDSYDTQISNDKIEGGRP